MWRVLRLSATFSVMQDRNPNMTLLQDIAKDCDTYIRWDATIGLVTALNL